MVALAFRIVSLFLRCIALAETLPILKPTHKFPQEGKPRLQDGDGPELPGGGEDDRKRCRQLVRLLIVASWGEFRRGSRCGRACERFEFVAESS